MKSRMEGCKVNRKDVIWNIIGTSANAFTSLFFLIIVTRLNGLVEAGIFSFAFSNACILSIVGMYMGRTYQVSETDKDISDSDYIYNRYFTCAFMIGISIIMMFLLGYSKENAMVFLTITVYKTLEAFSDVLYGILQKREKLYLVGKSFFLKAVGSVITFLIVDIITKKLWLACLAMCIVCLGIILFYDIRNTRQIEYISSKFKMSNNIMLFKKGMAICITTLLANYIISASKYAIEMQGYSEWQAIYGIILMPATVLSLLGQFVIHPCLLNLTKAYYKKDFNRVKKIVCKMLLVMSGIGLCAVIAAYFMGIPVLELLYGVKLEAYKIELVMIMLGAIFYGCAFILLSLLTVMRYTNIQMVIYISLSVIAFVLSFILVGKFQVRGAANAYLTIMVIEFIVYGILAIKCIKKDKEKINLQTKEKYDE